MKDFLKIYWPAILLAVAGIVIAFRIIEPPPPDRIVFAAGGSGGAYYDYATRYAALMEDVDIEVEVIETGGTLDNLRLLEEGEADVALIQGAVSHSSDDALLRALAAVFYEPYWVFVRDDAGVRSFTDLRSARFAIGGEGSGTRHLSLTLMSEYGGDWPDTARINLGGARAADMLREGRIDAAAFSASVGAPYIAVLAADPSLRLLPFRNNEALSRREEGLAPIVLPEGLLDVGRNVPPRDVPMVAAVAQLAVREDFHPAVQSLLLEKADLIHRGGTLLSDPGEFPNIDQVELPPSEEAQRYAERGAGFLRRYLPFSIANFVERTWVLLIPLLTLLIPLVRIAPPLYRWQIRRKIYVWYDDLQKIEARALTAKSADRRDAIAEDLDAMQREISQLDVPLSYTDDVYRLRSHVEFVRQLAGVDDPDMKVEPLI